MMIFEKMISGSGQNLVSGFLVSGFYDQIRVERERGFPKHQRTLPNSKNSWRCITKRASNTGTVVSVLPKFY